MNMLSCRYSDRSRLRAAVAGVVGAAMTLGVAIVQAQPSSAASVSQAAPAVWQPYELTFHYFGITTYYSCSGLEDRLEQILQEVGANKDVRVTASGCFGMHDVNNMLSARIRVRMPTAPSEAAAESFPAVSKSVMLTTGRSGSVGSGDCELLEQVRDQLLPALKLQLVKDDLHCVPGQVSIAPRALQVMALLPEPVAK